LKILEDASDGIVISVTAAPSCPGRIYVEGWDSNRIWRLCLRMPGVLLSKGMTLVPIDDRADLFKIRTDDRRITAHSWVRLRRGPNKGDLAYVLDASLNCDEVRIAVVPRMAFTIPVNMGSRMRKRKRTIRRLAPWLFVVISGGNPGVF
jgi:hypothetical protein